MQKPVSLTEGKIMSPLLKFAIPVMFALFLQAMYGAVDLMVVGMFSAKEDASAVATGSLFMQTVTDLISSLSMGLTVYIGQKMGEGNKKECSKIIGAGVMLFGIIGIVLALVIFIFSQGVTSVLQAPVDAFMKTDEYIKICGAGLLVIIFYNLLGSIFRGFGDSKTPLIAVVVACVFNIFGDLLLVAGFDMGAKGAAIATVSAQLVSVLVSLLIIKKKKLIEGFSLRLLHFSSGISKKIMKIGAPIAFQDCLVSISFLVIMAIINTLGVVQSAGVGVAEKLCLFIMLVPIAFMQSMSAIVAQNRGAGKPERAIKTLRYALIVSMCFGAVMGLFAFFRGDLLAGLFSKKPDVIFAASDYLRAYAVDCLFTCFLFCFIGFFNGMEKTTFVMLQGMIGAFLVRIPVAFLMSKLAKGSLFMIGLASPCSSLVQIIICFAYYFYVKRKMLSTVRSEK